MTPKPIYGDRFIPSRQYLEEVGKDNFTVDSLVDAKITQVYTNTQLFSENHYQNTLAQTLFPNASSQILSPSLKRKAPYPTYKKLPSLKLIDRKRLQTPHTNGDFCKKSVSLHPQSTHFAIGLPTSEGETEVIIYSVQKSEISSVFLPYPKMNWLQYSATGSHIYALNPKSRSSTVFHTIDTETMKFQNKSYSTYYTTIGVKNENEFALGKKRAIDLIDTRSKAVTTVALGTKTRTLRCEFSKDKNYAAVSSHDQTLKLFDLRNPKTLLAGYQLNSFVKAIDFHPTQSKVVFGGGIDDRTVRVANYNIAPTPHLPSYDAEDQITEIKWVSPESLVFSTGSIKQSLVTVSMRDQDIIHLHDYRQNPDNVNRIIEMDLVKDTLISLQSAHSPDESYLSLWHISRDEQKQKQEMSPNSKLNNLQLK